MSEQIVTVAIPNKVKYKTIKMEISNNVHSSVDGTVLAKLRRD